MLGIKLTMNRIEVTISILKYKLIFSDFQAFAIDKTNRGTEIAAIKKIVSNKTNAKAIVKFVSNSSSKTGKKAKIKPKPTPSPINILVVVILDNFSTKFGAIYLKINAIINTYNRRLTKAITFSNSIYWGCN